MIAIRAKLLDQRPYSGLVSTVPRPEPDEIEAAVKEIRKTGISDRNSARIAAFAWYSGVDSSGVLELFRARGTARILRDELNSHKHYTARMPDLSAGEVFRHLSEFSLAKALGIPELGWAVAILSVAAEADFDAIINSLGPQDDPVRIASYFIATRPFIAPRERRPLIAKLLSLDDSLSQEVAITVLSRWIEDAVMRGDVQLEEVLEEVEKNKDRGAVILGALLESTRHFQSPRFPIEIVDRATSIRGLIDAIGKKIVVNASTVRAILKRAGVRDLNLLAAMSHWRLDPGFVQNASKALGRTAQELLDREFGTRLTVSEEVAAIRFTGGAWSIKPLVQALTPDGIEVAVFKGYFEALAIDSLSKMTRHRMFLEDRQRAIILLAVAGLVAHERADDELLEAVKKAANLLRSQPPGVVQVLSDPGRQQLEEKLGLVLPDK
ncbi:MAG TPA: hypothetical protein VFE01_01065 [Terracidiphilus sp.]|nr:hypothetical protein [Terracidiphilus sp.]